MNKLIASEIIYNEDWKTMVAKNQEPIPKGAEVEYIKAMTNCYGHWWLVKYNGNYYYANPQSFITTLKENY